MASWLTFANAADHSSSTGPDYYRDQFPYTLPPLVQFEREPVPLNPTHDIWITDTTFRDGQQSRAPYSVDQIVHLYSLLQRLGGKQGMVRQSEFFLYTKKDREAVEQAVSAVWLSLASAAHYLWHASRGRRPVGTGTPQAV